MCTYPWSLIAAHRSVGVYSSLVHPSLVVVSGRLVSAQRILLGAPYDFFTRSQESNEFPASFSARSSRYTVSYVTVCKYRVPSFQSCYRSLGLCTPLKSHQLQTQFCIREKITTLVPPFTPGSIVKLIHRRFCSLLGWPDGRRMQPSLWGLCRNYRFYRCTIRCR